LLRDSLHLQGKRCDANGVSGRRTAVASALRPEHRWCLTAVAPGSTWSESVPSDEPTPTVQACIGERVEVVPLDALAPLVAENALAEAVPL